MDKKQLIDKLKNIENINYSQASEALNNSDWDILDAVIYLEDRGIIEKPEISAFSTKDSRKEKIDIKDEKQYSDDDNNKKGLFEKICNLFDIGNNIFLKLNKQGKDLIAIPLTAVVVIMIFFIYGIIPLIIISYLFNIELHLEDSRGHSLEIDEVNNILSKGYGYIQRLKGKIKKGR